ncbi:unnamed protein product [Chironomus riparius]|uniref:F-box domain-containing protein n=1 Tax=Chironomus riparius TaxID=315576 RepID=A0A9N9S8X5_9DIPT|nr:unnamed protein product [Chironomus riparius]
MSSKAGLLSDHQLHDPATILDLPTQILERILSCVTKDHKQLHLVCKAFYNVLCKIYEDKIWFKLNSYDVIINDERLEKLQSLTFPMINCKLRQLRNLKLSYMQEVTEEGCEEFWEFLDVQGKFIQKLTIEAQIKIEVFNKIISKVENLTEISFEKINIIDDSFKILNLCGLERLQTLTIDACDNFDFKKLKLSEDVLQTFKFNASYCLEDFSEGLQEFLATQKELKHAIFPKPYTGLRKLSHNFLKNCKLEKLEWSEFYQKDEKSKKIAENILNQQTELRELKLLLPIWEDLLVKLIKNGASLKNFSGNFDEIDGKSLQEVLKLKNLENLEVINADLDSFSTENCKIEGGNGNFDTNGEEKSAKKFKFDIIDDCNLKIHNLTSLTLKSCTFSDPSTPRNLSKILTNLKILKCESFSSPNLKFDFNEIFANFTQVKELIFYEFCDMFREDSYKLDNNRIFPNHNLKTLKIHFPLNLNSSNFVALTANFPNLIDLEIYIHNQEQKTFEYEIETIFHKFKKLEKIFITFAFTCKIDFEIFELIKNKQNLKFLYLENVGFKCPKMKGKVEILNDEFEEIEILAEQEYGYKNCYVISIAKNHCIYNSKLSSIQDYIEVSTHDDERFFL